MKFSLFVCFTALLCPVMAQNSSNGAMPDIILPSQQNSAGPTSSGEPQDSTSVGHGAIPDKLKGLGFLRMDVLAYFSMENKATGGLTWSAGPIKVKATDPVSFKKDGGRTYADFSSTGARLVFDPPLLLGGNYTLAAWIQTPTPNNHGVIWRGSIEKGNERGCLLFLEENGISYADPKWKNAQYAVTKSPLNGWYHFAVTFDGNVTQCFLNGSPLDSYQGCLSDDLLTVGSSPYDNSDGKTRSAGISEQYIFSRALSQDEIKQVMEFSKPSATAPPASAVPGR